MLSPDPAICLIHPTKHPVGVCHLCLRDRLVRLSISGDSSSSQTLAPTSSSRSSSSSCSKPEDSLNCGGVVAVNEVGKLGTIFSLIESENEGQAVDSGSNEAPVPPAFPRSLSLSNSSLYQQHPRRSTSIRDSLFSRFPPHAKEGQIESLPLPPPPPPQQQEQLQATKALRKSKSGRRNGFFFHSPLPKPLASSTPLVNPVPAFVDTEKQQNHKHFSWISSLFRLRKRKKKASSSNGELQATETNFFPPEGWSDSVPRDDRLWRSRSVSSGRVLKRSSVGDSSLVRTSQPQPVSSLIAVDMKKVDNVLYDPEDDDGLSSTDTAPQPRTVASLMDLDHQQQHQAVRFGRSSSTGKWRKRTRGESPSSVLNHQPSSEWSFYLTPLRTFRRNTSTR